MAGETIINEVTTRVRMEGAVQATNEAQKLDQAFDGVAVASDKVEKATVSQERALNNLLRRIDPTFQASQQLANGQLTLQKAFEQGLISAEQQAQRLAQLEARYNGVAKSAEAAASASARSASSINSRLTVKDDFGGASRSADVEAYGRALDDLRAKYSPLYAAGQKYKASLTEINQALKVGAINEREHAQAVAALKASFAGQVENIKQGASALSGHTEALTKAGRTAGLTANHYQQLGYQVNDVFTQLASGSGVFQTFAQQSGQIYQVLGDSKGGVGGALKEIGGRLLGLVTPARLVFGGIAAAAVAAAVAYSDFIEQQKALTSALAGVGRGAGATVDQINAIAQAAGAASGISTTAATEIATALVRTGKISKDSIGGITELVRDYATTVGTDVAGATEILAKAFADPAKGAAELDAQLNFLDGRTLAYIRTLQASGQATQARAVLEEHLRGSLVKTGDQLGILARAWEFTKRAVSNGNAAMAASIQRMVDPSAVQMLESLQKARNNLAKSGQVEQFRDEIQALDEEIAKQQQLVDALNATAEAQAHVARARSVSKEADTLTADLSPMIGQYQQLLEQRVKLNEALQNPAMLNDAAATQQALAMVTAATNDYVLAGGALELQKFKNAQASQLELQAIGATTVQQQADIAVRQVLISLLGTQTSEEERLRLAKEAGEAVIARSTAQMQQSILAQQQELDMLELQTSTLGMADAARDELIAGLQAEQELTRQGIDLNSELAQSYINNAEAIASERAELEKKTAAAQASAQASAQAARNGGSSSGYSALPSFNTYQVTDELGRTVYEGSDPAEAARQADLARQSYSRSLSGGGAYTSGGGSGRTSYPTVTSSGSGGTSSASAATSLLSPIDAMIAKLMDQQKTVLDATYHPDPYADKNPDEFYRGGKLFDDRKDKQYSALEKQIDKLRDIEKNGLDLLSATNGAPEKFGAYMIEALKKAGFGDLAADIAAALQGATSSAGSGTVGDSDPFYNGKDDLAAFNRRTVHGGPYSGDIAVAGYGSPGSGYATRGGGSTSSNPRMRRTVHGGPYSGDIRVAGFDSGGGFTVPGGGGDKPTLVGLRGGEDVRVITPEMKQKGAADARTIEVHFHGATDMKSFKNNQGLIEQTLLRMVQRAASR
jgi:phage-related minor tail protein